MEAFCFENILLALAGLMISVMLKLQMILRKQRDQFSIKIFFHRNWPQVISTLLMVFVLLYFAKPMCEGMLGVQVGYDSYFYEVYALLVGYNNHAFFHDLMKKYQPKTNELPGQNESK